MGELLDEAEKSSHARGWGIGRKVTLKGRNIREKSYGNGWEVDGSSGGCQCGSICERLRI
eukprot:6201820-Pleurochrysis_carterae.AAC.2